MYKKIERWMLLFFVVSTLAAPAVETRVRKESLFNEGWMFQQADHPEFREIDFDDSGWRTLNLPHDWSIEGAYVPDKYLGFRDGFFPAGIGWYRKHFTIEADKKNKQFVIRFDGIYRNSEVWLNGRFLGRRPFGYVTFDYDLTSALKFGKDNVIAVRVDNSVPAGSRWYSGSGIYRNVHLIETGFVHFRNDGGIRVTTPVAEKDHAVVHAEYKVLGSFFSDAEIKRYKKNKWIRKENRWEHAPTNHVCVMRSILFDAAGQEVARGEKMFNILNYQKNVPVTQDLTVPDPVRWSVEMPTLYTLKSEIEYKGKVLDDQVTRIGIRKVEFIPRKGLMVNGKRAVLKGVCLHHDGGSVGAAVPEKLLRWRLQKLKDIGCNAIRTSHNPFAPEFYALCDEMGFYVFDEILDEWSSAWGYNFTEHNTSKAGFGYATIFRPWADTDLRDTIRRDWNHPSVIMWGIGNEIPEFRSEPETAKAICRNLIRICHEEDHTRPVALGNNNGLAGFPDEIDLLGFNYIMQNFYGSEEKGSDIYEEAYKAYPDKLHFGSETSRNEMEYFTAYRDRPYVIGQFIWTGIQYLGEVKAPKSGLRGWLASLLDMSCELLPGGALYDAAWNDGCKPVVHLTVSDQPYDTERKYEIFPVTGERVFNDSAERFSWAGEKGERKFVGVYSNCEEVELKLNGRSLGRRKNDLNRYRMSWNIDYEEGTLQAVGYQQGHPVEQCELITSGPAASLVARPVWNSMKRDGVDINLIEVTLFDRKGHPATDAANAINVNVTGSAKLAGIDTGNLFYKGVFSAEKRNAANGTMLVVIQSKKGTEPVQVTLTSEGLQPVVVDL